MYKKKNNKRVVIILSLFLMLGIIFNVFITERNLTIFEKAIKDSLLAVQRVILIPINYVGDVIKENKEKNLMYDEYENLKNQVDEVEFLNSKIEELESEIDSLQEVLNINNVLSDYVLTSATIISRDLSIWNDEVIIDKGEIDGISKDMAVVVNDGLIGKVVSTSIYNSTVRLLTSSIDTISVKIECDETYYGILTKYSDDKFIVEGISGRSDIPNGAIVKTTGMGDIFPSGIVVGKVKSTTTDNFDLAKVLEVESIVDFDGIKYVSVLKRPE